MSVSQVQGNKWAVVSIPTGAQGAKKALGKHLEYLEKFDEIVLMFDMDEPGQEAVAECIPLFTPGKAKIATLPVKDANEMLKAGRDTELLSAVWNAKAPTYEGVFSGDDVVDMPMVRYEITTRFPWEEMNSWTYGMRVHEMYAYGAGSGVGKTDTLRSIIAELVKQQIKVGTILLEEPDLALTLTTIAGKVDHCLYHIPGDHINVEQMEETKRRIAPYLFMYKTNGDLEIDSTISLIRYLVLVCGCQHIFLDHVTAVLDGYVGDQLTGMKLFMKALNDINKELPFTLHYVSHLRKGSDSKKTSEEGGRVTLDDFAGGKAVIQYSNFCFAIERNQQAEDEEDRDLSLIRCLKDRFTGQAVGRTMHLEYDRKTGIKHEVTPFDDFEGSSGDSTPEF
jgi:twinkle protein